MLMTILSNREIAPRAYRMRLAGDTRRVTRPGQFAQIAVPGFYLRRPISVCDCEIGEQGTLDIIYKVVGHGTEAMANAQEGAALDLLLGLGNGYDASVEARNPLLAGGGVGAPPLYGLCKSLLALGRRPRVALGFGTAADVILKNEFTALGVPVAVATMDGTSGQKGLVTDAADALGGYDYVFACGPEMMLKAMHALCLQKGIGGQFSFEERMACGFGACMGCSCKTKYGSKRICKDGPVLNAEEIVW